jgi:hypothetical protein
LIWSGINRGRQRRLRLERVLEDSVDSDEWYAHLRYEWQLRYL